MEISADNLHGAGWSLGCISALDVEGRTIWILDAHGYGRRFIVRVADINPGGTIAGWHYDASFVAYGIATEKRFIMHAEEKLTALTECVGLGQHIRPDLIY